MLNLEIQTIILEHNLLSLPSPYFYSNLNDDEIPR